MVKQSVKKPFTVLVAVIMVLVLGVVSVTNMTTDLLPSMSLPYMLITIPYPGASPERVEADVVRPMESALGTITGVENVYSTSAENFGMVQLQFVSGTDMDSTTVKVTSAIQQVELPELCGTPSVIELSMDMMATMYVAVSREGCDVYELSNFVSSSIQPYIERQSGVASVDSIGLVEQRVQVDLDQEKIDELNARLLALVDENLAEAKEKLDQAEQEVASGQAALQQAQAGFGETLAGAIFGELDAGAQELVQKTQSELDRILELVTDLRQLITDGEVGTGLDALAAELNDIREILNSDDLSLAQLLEIMNRIQSISGELRSLIHALPDDGSSIVPGENLEKFRNTLQQLQDALSSVSELVQSTPSILSGLESAVAGLTQAQLEAAVQFSTASAQLSTAQTQLAAAREEYEAARETALENANLNSLLSVSTLSQLIYAQNFSMPAGYIDDKDDNSWLLKVGQEYTSVEDISGALLVSMEGLGDVRISDVATVTLIDNSGDSFTRLNGDRSVILSIYKNSVTGTNETANNCLAAFQTLEEKYEGTHILTLMNQGSYIEIIIQTVLSSMILGALLAIIILALFLRDFKPTLVVGISIPLSVMFALVLMYFTDISLNMMTLSGLALGIGMLVDNSIVVMENIYRLRGRGVEAHRAAVQGAKQVSGAIISSTLTTVCVFFPLVFTQGMIRDLLLPMGLCIGYCLGASLIVALTVVPASASTLLRRSKPKAHPLFDRFQNWYGRILGWCLDHKAVPLTASVALLALCVWAVMNMGIVLLPEMTGNQISVSLTTPDGLTREQSYDVAADVMDLLLSVDGVDSVGVMDSAAASGLLGGMSTTDSYGSYTFYIAVPDDARSSEIQRITDKINQAAAGFAGCELEASAGGMSEMTAMLGSGLSLNIYGDDLDTMRTLSQELVEVVGQVEGYTDIETSFSDEDPTIRLVIDRDAAMAKGLTVAQIYMNISQRLTTSATSTTVTLNGVTMDVTVRNEGNPLTLENLLDMEFTVSTADATGNTVSQVYKLSDFADLEETTSISTVQRENQSRYVTVSAAVAEGYNATLLSRQLSQRLEEYQAGNPLPSGCSISLDGESSTVNDMVSQLVLLLTLGAVFIYLVMVAQFQSLLSPFIVLFTVPLAFTGGMIALLVTGQQLSMLSLMGFAVLMGTVVNNGIVFVDYINQLRMGGLDRRTALIATGKTRMRPILMTALTTILAMFQLIFSDDMAGQMGRGMASVIVGGLAYATIMTLIIVPVMYDILFKRQPKNIDLGSENLDDVPDDAAEYMAQLALEDETKKAAERAENIPAECAGSEQ